MAAGLERRRVDLDSQCQRDNWADARDGGQPLAELVGIGCGIPFSVDLLYTAVDFIDLVAQKDEHLPGLQRYGCLLFDRRKQERDLSGALADDDAELGGVTTHCVNKSNALSDQCPTHFKTCKRLYRSRDSAALDRGTQWRTGSARQV